MNVGIPPTNERTTMKLAAFYYKVLIPFTLLQKKLWRQTF